MMIITASGSFPNSFFLGCAIGISHLHGVWKVGKWESGELAGHWQKRTEFDLLYLP